MKKVNKIKEKLKCVKSEKERENKNHKTQGKAIQHMHNWHLPIKTVRWKKKIKDKLEEVKLRFQFISRKIIPYAKQDLS